MMRFDGKTALVTGGASGIGAATASRFAEEGALVVVADCNAEKGQGVVHNIRERGGSALFCEVDLADEGSIRRCGAALAAELPSISILINNAGIVRRSSIESTSNDDWMPQIAINLRAPALMAQAVLPLMKSTGGAIVNVSSEGAFRARAEHWVYDATKAGICSLTRAMAVEFSPYGIRANAVAPGWIVTEMHFGNAPDPVAKKREMEDEEISACIIGRLGRPHEVANAILFLASEAASYVNATVLLVDGGLIAL